MTTDRKKVVDYETVLEDGCPNDLLEFIEELQSLCAQGYNRIETDAVRYHDDFEGIDDYVGIAKVSQTRLETDEEYNKRINTDEVLQEYRRRLYEQLKKEFEE